MKRIHCPICKTDNTKIFWRGKSRIYKIPDILTLVKCAVCDLVYINPQPEIEEISHIYSETYIPFITNRNDFSYNNFYRILSRIKHNLKRADSKNTSSQKNEECKRVLDVGCGDGSWLERQRKEHPKWELWGQDVSEVACRQTGARGFRIICKPLQETEFEKNYFDLIYMSHVLEHLANPVGDLKKIKAITKNGGRIVIHIPNINSISAKIFKGYWYGLQIPLHLFHFSPKTVRMMLEQSDFEIEKIEHYSDPKLFLKSLQILCNKKGDKMDPLLWHLLRPFGFLEKKLKRSSVVTVHAKPKIIKDFS